MRKIPTLFRRDPEDMKHVLPEVTPGCEWVLDGEGVATRKYDGTCVMLDGDGDWWARREVKPGKNPPPGWLMVDYDDATGKRVGWEPIGQSPFAKFHAEAVEYDPRFDTYVPGTYELIGPKVNSNPEGVGHHELVGHDLCEPLRVRALTFDGLRDTVLALAEHGIEGIVWHHPDGRMAKLKGRDFPSPTTPPPGADTEETQHG